MDILAISASELIAKFYRSNPYYSHLRSEVQSYSSPVTASMAVVPAELDEREVYDVSLDGLAEDWEGDPNVRRRARRLGSLLDWGGAAANGVVSMTFVLIMLDL